MPTTAFSNVPRNRSSLSRSASLSWCSFMETSSGRVHHSPLRPSDARIWCRTTRCKAKRILGSAANVQRRNLTRPSSQRGFRQFQAVTELALFGSEVTDVFGGGTRDERHALHDLQAIAFELRELGGVVAHQAQRRQAEVGQDLRAHVI